MWNNFILLFTEMNVAAAVCLIIGLVFVLVEVFYPGFGFFGIVGGFFLIAGIVVRCIYFGSGDPVSLLFIQLLLVSIIIILALLIMSRSVKRGWLSKSAIVENTTAVSIGISEGTEDYSYLIGKVGNATTMLRPSGSVSINDKTFDVVSEGVFIEKGKTVIVERVEGVKIIVKEIILDEMI